MFLNQQIFVWINQTFVNFIFDWFFPLITDLHKTLPFKILFPLFCFIIFYRKLGRRGLSAALVLFLCLSWSDFAGGRIKKIFKEPRPFQYSELNTIQRTPATENSSFYSNHASNSTACAVYLAAFFPEYAMASYGVAFLISYSRVYNGVHFPSDVLVGVLMGLLWGLAFKNFAQRLLKYLKSKEDSQ